MKRRVLSCIMVVLLIVTGINVPINNRVNASEWKVLQEGNGAVSRFSTK